MVNQVRKNAKGVPRKVHSWWKKGDTEFKPEQIAPLVIKYLKHVRALNENDDLIKYLATRTNFSIYLKDVHKIFMSRKTFCRYEKETNEFYKDWRTIFEVIDDEQVGALENRAIGGMFGNPALQVLMLKNKGNYREVVENINIDTSSFNVGGDLDKDLKDFDMGTKAIK